MEFKKLSLNIGGKTMDTTAETLKSCKRLYIQVINDDSDTIFIDRDPIVFAKTLKFLRGYPVNDQLLNDQDVIHELVFWQHELLFKQLPSCVKTSIKAYIKYDDTQCAHIVSSVNFNDIEIPHPSDDPTNIYLINTPDIDHLNKYKTFYYLVPEIISKQLLNITDAPRCNIVCSERWSNHVWIHKDELKMLLYKLKLRLVLYPNNNWCVCDIKCA